jgi:hypothetical protein
VLYVPRYETMVCRRAKPEHERLRAVEHVANSGNVPPALNRSTVSEMGSCSPPGTTVTESTLIYKAQARKGPSVPN